MLLLLTAHVSCKNTVKILNFRTPKMFALINLKFKERGFSIEKIIQKCADRMANSADPDQTATRSGLIWVYTIFADLSVRKLRIIQVSLQRRKYA